MDDPSLGYLIGGATILGVAFFIVLVSFIGWLQDHDNNRRQS